MCKYCDKAKLENDEIVSIIDENFLLFGDTFMEVSTSLGTDDDGNVEEEIYLSNFCVARKKVNFCPMCGRSLK